MEYRLDIDTSLKYLLKPAVPEIILARRPGSNISEQPY